MSVTVETGGTVQVNPSGTVSVTTGEEIRVTGLAPGSSVTNNISTFAQRVTDAAITGGVTTSVGFDSNVSTVYIDRYVIIDPYTVGAEIGVITGADAIAPVINATFDNSHSSGVPVLIVDRGAYLQAEWFGLDEGGSASNNSTALADFTAAVKATTKKGRLPAGEFDISSTWTIDQLTGSHIVGAGSMVYGTILVWAGSANGTAMLIQDSRETKFEGFRILVNNASHTLDYGIRMQNGGAGGSFSPTQIRLVDVYIDSTADNWLDIGVSIDDAGAGGDLNNDFHMLDHIVVQRARIAFFQDGLNIIQIRYRHCAVAGSPDGYSEYGLYCAAGNFSWENGSANYQTEADFYRSQFGSVCKIDGHDSEHCAAFYVCDNGSGGASGAPTVTTVSNVRWDRSAAPAAVPIRASSYIVEDKAAGHLQIDNSIFFTKAGESPVFRQGCFGTVYWATMELNGVVIDTDQTDYTQIFSINGDAQVTVRNCKVLDSSGAYQELPELNFRKRVNVGVADDVTIASGAITIRQSHNRVQTEGGAGTDDLVTINGGRHGDILYLRPFSDSNTVVVKDGTGNLRLEGDCTLDNTDDMLTLLFDGTNWKEQSRSNNGA